MKNHKGLSISFYNRIPVILNEKYGILDRDASFKDNLKLLAQVYNKQTNFYDSYEHDDEIDNLTKWLKHLTISINYNYEYPAIFNIYKTFSIDTDNKTVLNATIDINPKLISCEDLYSALYHEIKHIYDYLIKQTVLPLKENLFRDFIIQKELSQNYFNSYKNYLISNSDTVDDIMNIIGNFLYYIEKSECTAYLENIDQEYKMTLNDKELIIQLLYKGYKLDKIKYMLYYNSQTTNYLLIYYNIEKYIHDILNSCEDIFNNIDNIYKDNFKDIYNVSHIKQVLLIYLKRIDKIKLQSMKLFNDRYQNSVLSSFLNK